MVENQSSITKQAPHVYLFPKWANKVPLIVLFVLLFLGGGTIFVFWYWFSPRHLEVGYAPDQPIPFSHQLHVSELGIDCRYCHTNVERGPVASVPPVEVCMNCHTQIQKDKPNSVKLRESFEQNKPIEWVKVHDLPDYTYFDHSQHINAGVSCVSCHGRVDQMKKVHQVQPLSMGWCIECHRHPEQHIRPKEFVTRLDWKAKDQIAMGQDLIKAHKIRPREDCSTCHR